MNQFQFSYTQEDADGDISYEKIMIDADFDNSEQFMTDDINADVIDKMLGRTRKSKFTSHFNKRFH